MTDINTLAALSKEALGIGNPDTSHPVLQAFPTLAHPYAYQDERREQVEALFRQGFEALKTERELTGNYNNPAPAGEQIVVSRYRVYDTPGMVLIVAPDAIYHEEWTEHGRRSRSIRYDITPERLAAAAALRQWQAKGEACAAQDDEVTL